MAGAAALFARTTSMDLSVFSRALLMGLIGLIVVGILQLFIPSLRGTSVELLVSGFAVVLFAVFTAVDVQRLQQMSRLGGNPFMLALRLYLDIFNLFLSIVRFMVAISGNRR
jgi:FtsH-binding integral membrane protein